MLLGAKVCSAFEVGFVPFTVVQLRCGPGAIIPHPSGRNPVWGDPGAFGRARAVLVEAKILPFAT